MSDEGTKRKAEGVSSKASKKAKFFSTNKDASLPLHTRGILISCTTGKEHVSGQEALRLVKTYYDELAPKEEVAASTEDISKLISSEVKDLKDKKKQIFTLHKTAIGGLLYVIMSKDAQGPGPVDIVLKLGEDVKRTRQCRSRYCMRFTPVEDICEATLEAMTEAASSIVAPHFPDKDESTSTTTFAVHYEHRASVNLDRLKIINAVLTSVKQPPYKADLKNPDKTILVSVVKGFCAMSVVSQFRQLAKFNFRELSIMQQAPSSTAADAKRAVTDAVQDGSNPTDPTPEASKAPATGAGEKKTGSTEVQKAS